MDFLAPYFPLIKFAHIGLALLSGSIFAGRGLAVLAGGTAVALAPGMRRATVAIDTALLVAGLLMLGILHLDLLATSWLLAKLGLLVAYIGFGMVALRRARSTAGRVAAYAAALVCFTMMFSIARTHDPAGMLRPLIG